MIGLPPSEDGAVQLTVAWPSPAIALTPVGAPGTAAGVTKFDGPEAGLSPTPLVATTVKV
jgi:hypothetical protein